MSSEHIAFSKKVLNELATLDSSEFISPFSTNAIFEKFATFSGKNSLAIFQKSLLSVTFFKSSLKNIIK